MTTTFNLTPKRLEVLAFVEKHPGVVVSAVAQEVLAKAYDDGRRRQMSRQGATRTGAGYCKALAKAGYLHLQLVLVGYAYASLTDKGRNALREHRAKNDPANKSLDDVLLSCTKEAP